MYDGKTLEWRHQAHELITELANNNSIIVSNMLVGELEKNGLGLKNYSVLGGVFRRAAKSGLIAKTDVQQQSTLARTHSAKTIWRSLVYRAPGTTDLQNTMVSLLIAAIDHNGALISRAKIVGMPDINKHDAKSAVQDLRDIEDAYQARISSIIEQCNRHDKKGVYIMGADGSRRYITQLEVEDD